MSTSCCSHLSSAGCVYLISQGRISGQRRKADFTGRTLKPHRIICGLSEEKKVPVETPKDIVVDGDGEKNSRQISRRELLLSATSFPLFSFINFRGKRPDYLGVQKSFPSLALCPATPTCISTAEELNDPDHYVPPWTYNPSDGRGLKNPVSREQAMQELVEVVEGTKPDNYTPRVVRRTEDYLYVEYESPLLKFIDDVEFWFPPGNRFVVEYRSASRVGSQDFNVNRKRIKALRLALEKEGWRSVGY